MDIKDIMEVLPHRYPFLLIDKVIEHKPFESGVGIKNVTVNEPYFQGHFADLKIVPGVIIVESCAQMLGLVCANREAKAQRHQYLAAVKEFQFKQSVVPGDVMHIKVKVSEKRFNLIQGSVKVKTKRGLVASGIIVNTNME